MTVLCGSETASVSAEKNLVSGIPRRGGLSAARLTRRQ